LQQRLGMGWHRVCPQPNDYRGVIEPKDIGIVLNMSAFESKADITGISPS